MIWFILALIISIVIWIKEADFCSFLWSLLISFIVAFIIAVSIRALMPSQYEIVREEKLLKMSSEESYITIMNNDSSSGSSSPTMVFTAIGKNDIVITYRTSVIDSINGNSKTIVETDVIEPKYVRQKMRPMYEYWELFGINLSSSKYVLYVPKGSIEYDYNVK